MSKGLNKCFLSGNLTRDVQTRTFGQDNLVAETGIAVSGLKEGEVNFFDLQVYRGAENFAKYMKKGSFVTIDGRLKYESWDDKNGGGKRSKVVIIVEDYYFGPKSNSDNSGGGTSTASGKATKSKGGKRNNPFQEEQADAPVEEEIPY
jgi:single-strand DNA-binding protein